MLGNIRVKLCDGHLSADSERLTQSFDALYLVHGPGGKVRLSAMWTRPHRYALNDKERFTASKATSHAAKLKPWATTRRTQWTRRGRP